VVDGWQLSGITTYQTGFPIRITSSSDNELMNSADFEYRANPIRSRHFVAKATGNGGYYFNTPSNQSSIFTRAGSSVTSAVHRARSAADRESARPMLRSRSSFRLPSIPLRFRGELFNVFNHTQFYNPDGNSTDGQQFGQVTEVKDPRLAQFALKFYF